MPRRTKACAICRQKRIKCDATLPHCLMCKRFGRQCPGPTDAPLLFIDTSSYPSGKKPRKKVTAAEDVSKVWENISDSSSSSDGKISPLEETSHVQTVNVSPRYVLSEAFFANLVGFFCAEGRHMPGKPRNTPSWLYALPRMAVQSTTQTWTPSAGGPPMGNKGGEALSLALRATTAAFSGVETRNMTLLEYAGGLYGAALRMQGRVLAGDSQNIDMSMVASSVMLSMFETIVATTGTAFAAHVVGTAKLFDVAILRLAKSKPEEVKSGLGQFGAPSARNVGLLGGPPAPSLPIPPGGTPPGVLGGAPPPAPSLVDEIFVHLRAQLAYVYLTTNEASIRADETVKRVLIDACGRPTDRLPLHMQILKPFARLTELYWSRQTPHSVTSSPLTDASDDTGKSGSTMSVEEKHIAYNRAKEEVEGCWRGYQAFSKGQRLCWRDEATGHTNFRDPFTAINYAYYSACKILLQLVDSASPPMDMAIRTSPSSAATRSTASSSSSSPRQAPSTSFSSPRSPAQDEMDHHALILSVAWYLRLREVGFSYLRLCTPLVLVAMHAPRGEQRRAARMVFEEWKRGSLKGIGSAGLDRIYEAERWREAG